MPPRPSTEREAIERLLPHRDPFLFVDAVSRVYERDDGCPAIEATYHVAPEAPSLQGHFPGRPLQPGVLLIEGMAQAAGLLCAMTFKEAERQDAFLVRVDKTWLRTPVLPGQDLVYRVALKKRAAAGRMLEFDGEVLVGDKRAAESTFILAVAPKGTAS